MLTKPLYPYQEPLVDKFLERSSLLLAADPGTGKTPVSIAAAEVLLGEEEIDCCMIVALAGLRWQWAVRIAQFTDVDTEERVFQGESVTVPTHEYCIVVDGSPERRRALYDKIRATRPDYVIMSYEAVVNDWRNVRRIQPGMIVLDEATAIKSFKARRTRKVKRLTAPNRLAVTGTGVETVPEEVYSIMQWVDPDVLGRFDLFDKSFIVRNKFGAVVRYKHLGTLHKKLSTAMARVTHDDPEVAPYLPDKRHHLWTAPLSADHRRVYVRLAKDLLAELEAEGQSFNAFNLAAHYGGTADENTTAGKIMARHTALQMYLNHPDLLRRSAAAYASSTAQRARGVTKKNWPGSKYAHEVVQGGLLDGLEDSPKLDYLDGRLARILADDPGAKIIVFSAYREMLALFTDHLAGPSYSVQYHGEMSQPQKIASISRFQTDPGIRFLFSSHAGGYGLDIPAANWLVNFDLPWSHGQRFQLNSRHVRASSKHAFVNIVDLVMADTIEERKPEILKFRGRLSSAILDGTGADAGGRIDNDVTSLTAHLAASLYPQA